MSDYFGESATYSVLALVVEFADLWRGRERKSFNGVIELGKFQLVLPPEIRVFCSARRGGPEREFPAPVRPASEEQVNCGHC
jgi:hypothetical protein